jgi:probable HAF family extracellular repeat protein
MILKLRHFNKRIKHTIDVNVKQRCRQSRGIAGHLVLVFMLGVGVSSSAYSLEIIDLGPDITPKDINNNGTVVGAKITDKTKPWTSLEAFRWTRSGGYETLDSVYSIANAINDNEQIVGNTRTALGSPMVAFSYNGNTFNSIGTEHTAQGINQLGQVAGSQVKINPCGRRANGTNPAIYDLNTQSWSVADITTFRSRGRRKCIYAGLMRLTDINDSGIAIGNRTFSGLINTIQPFILPPDVQAAEFFPVPYGGTAAAINNLNHIVGRTGSRFLGFKSSRTVYNHAYFYDYNNADFVDLGTLSGAVDSVSSASDINESDQVVGSSTLFEVVNTRLVPGIAHAFIWENGTMTDLNDLIPPNTGWVLVSATAINDNGDIVGLGIKNGVTRGYVLDASTGTAAPDFTSPVSGSSLSGSTETFSWSTNTSNVTEWWLYAGSAQGFHDYYNSHSLGSSLTTNVTGLPVDGSTVYTRLWYKVAGAWLFIDSTYTAATLAVTTPAITNPASGSALSASTETFSWSANTSNVTEWWLYAGSAPGRHDFYDSRSLGNSLTTNVPGLPVDGSTIYVRLWYRVGGSWRYIDITYIAVQQ